MSRKLEDLGPPTKAAALAMLAKLEAAKIPVIIIETKRSAAVQAAYYAQGRESLGVINERRRGAGLSPIGEEEAKRIITKTLFSRHMIGGALDIVPIDNRGQAWWNAPDWLWLKIGAIGEEAGLEWGGRWDAKPGRLGWDCPHFQLKNT